MNVDELASELFDLVVIKGRKTVERWGSSTLGYTFDELSERLKEGWRVEAEKFAKQYNFKLDPVEPEFECIRGNSGPHKVKVSEMTEHSRYHDRIHGRHATRLSDFKVGDRVRTGYLPRHNDGEHQHLACMAGSVLDVTSYYVRVALDNGNSSWFLPDEIDKTFVCPRCTYKHETYFADMTTHSQVDDDRDAGRPSRYADYWSDYDNYSDVVY